MTAAQFEHTHLSQDDVDISPLSVFFILMIAPYIFFFGLLMLLTGQFDLYLLYTSVVQISGTAYIKAWMIGSFLLAIAGTLLLSGYRTTNYLAAQLGQKQTRQNRIQSLASGTHYSIEELPHDQEAQALPHPELERILDEEGAGTPAK